MNDTSVIQHTQEYLFFMKPLIEGYVLQQETAFLLQTLSLNKNSTLLDMPCGYGRLSNALGEHISKIVGVDLDECMLDIAQTNIPSLYRHKIHYLKHDLRIPLWLEKFDAVIVMFNSFGNFTLEEDARLIENIANNLKPDGKFVVEILDSSFFEPNLTKTLEFTVGEACMQDRLARVGDTLSCHRIYNQGGVLKEENFSTRLYTLEQFAHLLQRYGLEILQVHPAFSQQESVFIDARLMIVGAKIFFLDM